MNGSLGFVKSMIIVFSGMAFALLLLGAILGVEQLYYAAGILTLVTAFCIDRVLNA